MDLTICNEKYLNGIDKMNALTGLHVLCSTGALGYQPDLLTSGWLKALAPAIACDGFELMIYSQWKAEDARESPLLRDGNVRFPAAHLSKRLGERYGEGTPDSIASGHALLRDNCELAHTMGAARAVLHLWGLPHSDDRFGAALDTLGEALDIAQEFGVELLVETLPCRSAPLMERLLQIAQAYPRCRFTADTRLLHSAGALNALLDADWLWDGGHIAHVHISDCALDEDGRPASHPILQPGQGVIDFTAFFAGLRRRGYRGSVTLESPAPKLAGGEPDALALNRSLAAIREWLSPPG